MQAKMDKMWERIMKTERRGHEKETQERGEGNAENFQLGAEERKENFKLLKLLEEKTKKQEETTQALKVLEGKFESLWNLVEKMKTGSYSSEINTDENVVSGANTNSDRSGTTEDIANSNGKGNSDEKFNLGADPDGDEKSNNGSHDRNTDTKSSHSIDTLKKIDRQDPQYEYI
jgi:hypothetical protein